MNDEVIEFIGSCIIGFFFGFGVMAFALRVIEFRKRKNRGGDE